MIYCYSGTDYIKRKKSSDAFISVLEKKRPDAEVFRFDTDNFNAGTIEQYIHATGLFDNKVIIVLHGLHEVAEQREWLHNNLKQIVESENAFVLIEENLTKPQITKLEKGNVTVNNFPLEKKQTNPFVLSDALVQKDKQKLLVNLYEQIDTGQDIEPLVGILMSQLKQIQITKNFKQTDSGLKAFSYNKASRSKWSDNEITDAYHTLITEYHDSRRNGLPLFERVERFILEM